MHKEQEIKAQLEFLHRLLADVEDHKPKLYRQEKLAIQRIINRLVRER